MSVEIALLTLCSIRIWRGRNIFRVKYDIILSNTYLQYKKTLGVSGGEPSLRNALIGR